MAGDLFAQIAAGEYIAVLTSEPARVLIRDLVKDIAPAQNTPAPQAAVSDGESCAHSPTLAQIAAVGLAAFNAFLQLNVTGPVLESVRSVEVLFEKDVELVSSASETQRKNASARALCLKSLDVDGVSVYPYIPNIELFCLARYTLATRLSGLDPELKDAADRGDGDPGLSSLPWLRLRVLVWHHKLFIQPSLSSGSGFNRGAQWSDVPSLQEQIIKSLADAEQDTSTLTQRHKAQFLLEKSNVCIMLGLDAKAKQALAEASESTGFTYALSGALGKRTKFQEKSTSQLVVLAKSAAEGDTAKAPGAQSAPESLPLNDDTLLEQVDFTDAKSKTSEEDSSKGETSAGVPEALRGMAPDDQPHLSPLDQIILLAEATIKDAFAPTDSLTSEEILPFAERVVSDTSTNWQIYTHALLVRSRIEIHRSRTVERGVLQMQAVVDQVIVDTETPTITESTSKVTTGSQENGADESSTQDAAPAIEITAPDEAKPVPNKPTSFFPKAKPSESAPAHVRLQFIHTLSSPPRWHLESELAFAWTGVGSLVAALDIFKRLRLWAEVSLCLATAGAQGEEDDAGRGSGSEEKGRAVLRWRLFQPTDPVANPGPGLEDLDVDVSELRSSAFMGPERDPQPSESPRLYCILGDMEQEPAHYKRAWELSGRRYARAQRSLGEHYLQKRDWEAAREAYIKATTANRLSPEMWSRLGDINLRLTRFADAADAFRRAIGSAGAAEGGEDARTWSNLGSALYSMHCEAVDEAKKKKQGSESGAGGETHIDAAVNGGGDDADVDPALVAGARNDPATLLTQSLAAYKRGASIAHDNWRIWDNVLTLAARTKPPAINEILPALRQIMRIRATEDALDVDVLKLLVDQVLVSAPKPDSAGGVYEPPRGSLQRQVVDFIEGSVVPLITVRSELWVLVGRERAWRRDYAGAIDAAEKGWRAAIGDELVSMLENYGPDVEAVGARWRGKARTAVRSVMGKAKENWEGSEGWKELERLLEGLQS
ncbi:TPR repeat-containing protein [Gaeumannomyces tritici R3-111a-1]|uniref:TPR repeat-containing protein n=1 Tax=Gaeumannomyces tritici (strain R3-111a-1) TaxID=644352 RepID=J3PJP9_GAET3|nr:TPR repeat-containing protein [Gaeumannomyces tritici R3-111a-1]EJT68691.1 TPR repeat-containing protein [Gaeumannomyces tritici R3-111a-1]